MYLSQRCVTRCLRKTMFWLDLVVVATIQFSSMMAMPSYASELAVVSTCARGAKNLDFSIPQFTKVR